MTEVSAEFVAKPLILGILLSILVILTLQFVFLTSLPVSTMLLSVSIILFSKSDLSVSYLIFQTSSLVSILFYFSNNL